MTFVEREVKFAVQDLERVRARLQALGAREIQPRTHEYNVRWDTPDRRLRASDQVLRLRRDQNLTLTYKGRLADPNAAIAERVEVNVPLSQGAWDAAYALLQHLGYEPVLIYEKYRAVYRWEPVAVMLDETPLGAFVEIEGPDAEALRRAAQALGLRWDRRMTHSYAHLFRLVQARLNPAPEHLTFAAFAPHQPLPPDWLPQPWADVEAPEA